MAAEAPGGADCGRPSCRLAVAEHGIRLAQIIAVVGDFGVFLHQVFQEPGCFRKSSGSECRRRKGARLTADAIADR